MPVATSQPLTATPPPVPARVGLGRLTAVALVVFVANAGLLVLQLAAGRLLVPFVGSSLETWTAVIGMFLAGIALGNAAGGRAADRDPSPRALARFLAYGAAAAVWLMLFPKLLAATGWDALLPLAIRIPVLAFVACFPAGFALSLPTPVAIKLGLPDVRRAGRAAGMVFAVGTLGCLAGNYAAGFYLIPMFTVDAIIRGTVAVLLAVALFSAFLPFPRWGEGPGVRGVYDEPRGLPPWVGRSGDEDHGDKPRGSSESEPLTPNPSPARGEADRRISLPRAYVIVFLASFGGMALELAAVRILAQVVGVSLFTWTGVIGVMLAGTACGNWLGGGVADRAGKSLDPAAGANTLAGCLVAAAAAAVVVLVAFFTLSHLEPFAALPLVPRVLAWTFALFFLPMTLLGTISPQVIRLAVTDVSAAGRVAGRVYAWSIAGAIAGAFATGYILISTAGMYRTVLGVALAAGAAASLVARIWERRAVLYVLSIALGAVFAGFALLGPTSTKITRETNYFTIRVVEDANHPGVLKLQQDMLVHSWVNPADPAYLHYPHEQVQMEFLRAAGPGANVLVIGGGGYTFPRAAKTELPRTRLDVVEIDPGVTAVAYSHLGLDPALDIRSFNMDGRQFVAGRAAPGTYELITLDAVNDLSVPYHLLTAEFNAAARRVLAPGGVYLVTVIDYPQRGRLWKAVVHTLRRTFAHVELLLSRNEWAPADQAVMVVYASDRPLDLAAVRSATRKPPADAQATIGSVVAVVQPPWFTHRPPAGEADRFLAVEPPLVLTDQFAPVDNLMADVFRWRKGEQ